MFPRLVDVDVYMVRYSKVAKYGNWICRRTVVYSLCVDTVQCTAQHSTCIHMLSAVRLYGALCIMLSTHTHRHTLC